MLFVMFSISPVSKLLPGPVSYFHTDVSTPVVAALVKSSLPAPPTGFTLFWSDV